MNDRIEAATRSAWLAFNAAAVEALTSGDPDLLLSQVKRRDWNEIIRTIIASGMTYAELATKLGIRMRAVQHWRDDPRAEPKDRHARMLMVLYRRARSG